ncbi:unnamed protein product, partial [Polarella glacialis]
GFFVAVLRKKAEWPAAKTETTAQGGSRKSPQTDGAGYQLHAELIPKLSQAVGETSPLGESRLLARGSKRLFLCAPRLSALLQEPRSRQLSLVAAGVCAAQLSSRGSRSKLGDRGGSSDSASRWQLTPAGVQLLVGSAAARGAAREVNSGAAKKFFEGHLCAGCGRRRPGACFSRKMLTRPPAKRKCADCVQSVPASTAKAS